MVVALLVGVLPVVLFLAALVLLDSYKLISPRAIIGAVGAGAAAALVAYMLNVWLRPTLGMDSARYAIYVGPVVEECLKATYVAYLLSRSKAGFVVDAAIYGFGIGTGFAVVENVYYATLHADASFWLWIVRGFGTALMHGGATAILAMVTRALHDRFKSERAYLLLPGLCIAVMLHSLYNQFLLQPLLAAALIVLVLPALAIAVFQRSEGETRSWLGTGFDLDQELLRAVRAGEVSATPVGQYLRTLRNRFPPEVIVDMMCLLRLHAELGIRAKTMLMLREEGFEAEPDPRVAEKFEELRYLRKSIGRTGMLALQPFIHTSTRDLWQLNLLETARGPQ